MFKGIFYMAVLAVALVLYSDLAESQCTTKYCQDHGEADLLAVPLRNKEVVEQLQQELTALNVKHEHNQEGDRRMQDEIKELKEKVARLEKKLPLGTSRPDAARSCKQILNGASDAANGVYWICASNDCTDVREVFCDMRSGGWTLIGQVGGVNESIYDKWLVTNHNTEKRTSVIEARTFGCIDAVGMAVNYAHEIRLSSGESDAGMGQFWVEWDLPADRDVDTFWKHSVGRRVVWYAKECNVEVRSSFAFKKTCCHNKYGLGTDGEFPTTNCKSSGNRDVCMGVEVMSQGSRGDGFYSSFLSDAPTNNTDWPNKSGYSGLPGPFLSVWLR